MSWRYLRTFDHLTNISKLKNQNQQNQQQLSLSFTTSTHQLLNSTTTTSTSTTATVNNTNNSTTSNTSRTTTTITTTKNPISYYSSTIMKLLKPNSLTNITIFFAASLVAAWSMAAPLLLVDGSGTGAGNGSGTNEASKSSSSTDQTSVDSVPVDSTSSNDANSKASTSASTSNNEPESSSPTTSSTATSTTKSTTSSSSSSRPNKKCPSYGCPLLPRDMYFDKEAQAALQEIRNLQQKVTTPLNNNNNNSNNNLSLFYNEAFINTDRSEDQATLTLIGYKGGELSEQINQDRAFVISPFYIYNGAGNDNGDGDAGSTMMRLLGVFDGHAKLGERVSEYSVRELPQLLSSKLETILSTTTSTTSNQNQQKSQIQNAINDTFIEIDKTAPAHESGGCTASIVLQIHSQIYVANAGDSRSFIATYHKQTKQTNIVYITREDKPDIPEERQRVENAGGEVYIPSPDRVLAGASSRVVYVDKNTGSRNGLAMSRSIGDWAAGEKGVIPNPTVEVLDMEELIRNADSGGDSNGDCQANYDNREEKKDDMNNDNTQSCSSGNGNGSSNNVEVFAVSATDGLLDFSNVEEIAKTVAMSLYVEDTPHPLSACESLITTAASSWWQAKNGRYRDDIAIAVSKLSLS